MANCELIEGEKDWIKSVLERFRVSYTRGFIPDKDPLLDFTDPYFCPWDEIFKDLGHLIQCGRLREAVENMPLLDHTKLSSQEDWDRALMVLSAIGNGYVWQNGENDPAKFIPKHLAVPWAAAAEHSGSCPVIGHWNGIINNWKIKDRKKLLELDNIETQFVFTSSKDEFWFCGITWQLEMNAVPGIKELHRIHRKTCLMDLSIVLRLPVLDINHPPKANEEFSIFFLYRVLSLHKRALSSRILLHKNTNLFGRLEEQQSIPGRNYLRRSEFQTITGGSAAQSAIFQVFDAVLGITHPKVEGGKKAFLESMLDYIPKWHREFILYVRNGPSVHHYVQKSGDENLKKIYNECVESLIQFRSFHIQIVTSNISGDISRHWNTRYITIPASKGDNDGVKMLASQGTGGTGIMPFLKGVRQDTVDVKIDFGNNCKGEKNGGS